MKKGVLFGFIAAMVLAAVAYMVLFQTNILNGKNLNDPNKKPYIEFAEKDHDFGKINEGVSVEHIFQFTNKGNDTLKIIHVKASCGCTAALLSNTTIAPGEKGEIKAVFNSQGRPGMNKKTISVISNDKDHQQIVLTFKAEVIPAEKTGDKSGMETLFDKN